MVSICIRISALGGEFPPPVSAILKADLVQENLWLEKQRPHHSSHVYHSKLLVTRVYSLFGLCNECKYLYWYRSDERSDIVKYIFWTHHVSMTLLNAFPIVFMMDSTYKTNKYHLPLLEIVDVTSTELNFSMGFSYMEFEHTDNFQWALERL
ncbi:hypothetical protein L6164_016693 [Bauhinia variegata]|uniref:Uncharacterized protein n=1 Tax=Bauhinia variegata TaxID=167791 RepID=A0ACB9NPG5_BAUVA|nr:hypothetical protein L6164_016693 [Bauhinia variegata]